MGIQINGNTDNISATDGGLTVSDLELNQTGVSTFHSHLHVADQIIHLDDVNSKIRFPAADTITAETAGSEKVRITSTGAVGIGTDNPDRIFHITNASPAIKLTDSDNSLSAEINGSSGNIYLDTHNNNRDIIFRGATTEVTRITGDGDLLLGAHGSRIFDDSSGTNVVVDIYGGTTAGKRGILALGGRTGSDNADIGTIQFLNENNANATSSSHVQSKLVASIDVKSETTTNNASANSGSHLIFSTKGENAALAERLRITSTGYVGINTSFPQYPLHVAGHTTDASPDGIGVLMGLQHNHALIHLNAESDLGCIIDFSTPNTDRRGGILYYHSNNSTVADRDAMQFHTAGSERLRIDANGRLTLSNSEGIKLSAKTSSLYALDGSLSYYSTTNGVYLNGAGANGWLRLNASGVTNSRTCIDIYGQSHTQADVIFFKTAAQERLRIASNGDIGLGTVPETDSYQPSLYFAGGNANIWGSGNANLYTCVNARYTGAGGWKYNNNGVASYVGQQSGVWNFFNAPSGTADATATFTERMRINGAGRIMMDTTAVRNNSTLTVKGSGVAPLSCEASLTSGFSQIFFVNPNGNVGQINTVNSETRYFTTSDYRLKENIIDLTGAITRLKTLRPKRFNWISDETNILQDGFLAHEVTAVPEAITGTKDEVDSDSNPLYQMIDNSKLVPLLTAALQEAITEIETLKTKVAALEGS